MADYHGSIVAFEGWPEIVSTQLRLLPISTQMLVLPDIQTYMPEKPAGTPFSIPSFLLALHEASVARRKLATDFLKDSSPTRKKLVFLNGGTASAHAFAVATILQRRRLDDITEAEAIFDEHIKHGLVGLTCYRTKASGPADAARKSKIPLRSKSQPAPEHRSTDDSPEPMPTLEYRKITQRNGDLRSPDTESLPAPASSSQLDIEQAVAINLTPLSQDKPPRRARSLERSAAPREVEARRFASVGPHSNKRMTTHDEGRRPSWLTAAAPAASRSHNRRPSVLDLRGAVVCKPSEITMTRQFSRRRARSRLRGADRGADDSEPVPKVPALDASRSGPSEPVLQLFEDLILHFICDTRHFVLEAMLQKLQAQAGTAPSPASILTCDDSGSEPTEMPATPTSPVPSADMLSPKQQPQAPPQMDDDEYDPFRPQSINLGPPSHTFATMHVDGMHPPTPAQTPPPPNAECKPMFRELRIKGMKAAVNVQDALRSVLSTFFPSDDCGYTQSRFPFLPEKEELWRPVFGAAEPGGSQLHKRKLDLIVAIGAQNDVSRKFVTAVVTQVKNIEKRTVEGCPTRTGRLDLRYLIANAMQTFLMANPQSKVFENPIQLATLIVPQLEIYVAAHADVHFIILEYPPEHLATVIALQRLAGPDVVKVASIITSESKLPDEPELPAPMQPHPPVSFPSKMSHSRTRSLHAMQASAKAAERLKLPQANFVLVAGATDAEIATFITSIWRALVDTSVCYIPEQLPPHVNGAAAAASNVNGALMNNIGSPSLSHLAVPGDQGSLSAVTGLPSPAPSSPLGHSSPSSSGNMSAALPPVPSPPLPPSCGRANHSRNMRPVSPAPSARSRVSVGSTRTAKTIRSLATAKGRLRGTTGAAAVPVVPSRPGTSATAAEPSLLDYDPTADSDYDSEERRLMPLFMSDHRTARKGNSHKALKWLGLA